MTTLYEIIKREFNNALYEPINDFTMAKISQNIQVALASEFSEYYEQYYVKIKPFYSSGCVRTYDVVVTDKYISDICVTTRIEI